jgi:hypothetical protein
MIDSVPAHEASPCAETPRNRRSERPRCHEQRPRAAQRNRPGRCARLNPANCTRRGENGGSGLEDVFSATERQLEAIPTYRAIELGQDRWLYVTHAALDAPSVVLFYEIEPTERTVSLLGVDLNE